MLILVAMTVWRLAGLWVFHSEGKGHRRLIRAVFRLGTLDLVSRPPDAVLPEASTPASRSRVPEAYDCWLVGPGKEEAWTEVLEAPTSPKTPTPDPPGRGIQEGSEAMKFIEI